MLQSRMARSFWKAAGVAGLLATGALVIAPRFGTASPKPAAQPAAAPRDSKPDIVVINVDDMDSRLLQHMPKLMSLIGEKGTFFTNAFVTTPLCCPSRVSLLRGQYAHNTLILANGSAFGGFKRFRDTGLEQSTLATWLQIEGYRTAMIGKYLNGYVRADIPHVAPGWDYWFASLGGAKGFNWEASENGERKVFGSNASAYCTDVLRQRAVAFVDAAAEDNKPLFLYVAPHAPHLPATPAPRHQAKFAGLEAPRVPSFNEENKSDKPNWIRELDLTQAQIDGIDFNHRKRAQSLLAVDEMIGALVSRLAFHGRLDNTYFLFTSDNGYLMGEHSLTPQKRAPYEESIRVPLLIRGPGVPAGATRSELVLNIDIAPTLAELGGANTPDSVDGRSFGWILAGLQEPPGTWRRRALTEVWDVTVPSPDADRYKSVRETRYKLNRWTVPGLEWELYDLNEDPYELESVHQKGQYNHIRRDLEARLQALAGCQKVGCRTLEDAN